MKLRTRFAFFLLPALALAQQTVAPTTSESTAAASGQNHGDYNMVQSWELGYRYATVGGDDGRYRSDINYHDGVRLLSSYLTINSRDGHGHYFDEITLSTQGLGNDPYESAVLRIQKNRLYRYDMSWRQNDYFNPGLTTALGEHLADTTYRLQDHELTLLPQNWFRVRAGYSRTVQSGAALTTEQEFAAQGDVFPIFRNLRQQYNEYRLGADVSVQGFRMTVQRRWELFREDYSDNLTTVPVGIFSVSPLPIPLDPSFLAAFHRAQPFRGSTDGWLGNLYAERKWLAVSARFTYAGGRGNFVQNEFATGTDRFANAQNRQILVSGNGDRPVFTGDLNVTVSPLPKLTVINATAVSNTRIDGNNSFTQFDNATLSAQTLNFQFLGIRLITNATDIRYRFTKMFDAFVGFRYSDRQIRSIEDFGAPPGSPDFVVAANQTNLERGGVAGFNLILFKDLRIHAEGEVGRDDHPFTPISLGNYHNIRSRAQYRKKTWSASGGYQQNYNNNSIQITAFSSRSRIWTGDASWNAKSWLAFDASYARTHLDTAGGLSFFAGSPQATAITGQESIYISNIHSGNLGVKVPVTKFADLYIGYNITKDVGDGRTFGSTLITAAPGVAPTAAAQAQGLFFTVQTYPLTYQTPLLRLSVKINSKLRYNLGYQYYGYHEDFGLLAEYQNYHAHTGYTSLLWSF
jgi:hypothetical protein